MFTGRRTLRFGQQQRRHRRRCQTPAVSSTSDTAPSDVPCCFQTSQIRTPSSGRMIRGIPGIRQVGGAVSAGHASPTQVRGDIRSANRFISSASTPRRVDDNPDRTTNFRRIAEQIGTDWRSRRWTRPCSSMLCSATASASGEISTRISLCVRKHGTGDGDAAAAGAHIQIYFGCWLIRPAKWLLISSPMGERHQHALIDIKFVAAENRAFIGQVGTTGIRSCDRITRSTMRCFSLDVNRAVRISSGISSGSR